MTESSGLSGIVAGRYRVDREVGQGGMATVYLAYDQRRHDTKVALKVLRPELASRLGTERFIRETRITAQLQHPNILPVFDSGESDGNPFFVMPYVEGETLDQRLRRSGPLPIEDAISIAVEIADALAYAHERGYVHRDVKPSNIMLSHGHAQLADFGIARAVDAASEDRLTETGLTIGTAAYMSPEQCVGQAVDGRTDVYALACVLYEMLAGTPPFTGPASVVLARHAADTAPSLRVVRDAVPESVERVIFKAMAKVPADRYPSAAAFRDALRQAVTLQLTAVEPGPSVQRRTLAIALGAALVTAAVIGMTSLWGGGDAEPVLDSDRILVLPLQVSGSVQASLGWDVATLTRSALDEDGGLRWIDGLALLDARPDSFPVPLLADARRMATGARAAHFVTGRITPVDDRVSITLDLYETGTGNHIATGSSPQAVPLNEAWQAGLLAANRLLPQLIGGAARISAEWLDREPRAIASFLRGEAAYRRVRYAEALEHYRDALAEDPTFAIAAIRGAQAAGWEHLADEAAGMITTALNLPLSPRYADFARGWDAFLAGHADSAVAALERTIAADREMAEAWLLLGEVHTHLLPEHGNPDELALAAFEEAIRLDPTAAHVLVHPIEIRIRRGNTATAALLLERFLAVSPDSAAAAKLDIMYRCVQGGADAMDWDRLAAENPLQLISATTTLSAAAAQPQCAIAGYSALLALDTAAADAAAEGRRYAAVRGLQNLLISTGRTGEAVQLVDSFLARWGFGSTLYLVGSMADPGFADRAATQAKLDREQRGPYAQWPPIQNFRMWAIGVVAAMYGDPDEADAIAAELERRAGGDENGELALMARSVTAQAALARGDTAAAMPLFDSLVPAVRRTDELSWDEFAPLAVERLTFARLLMADGDYRRALDVASVFDSPEPLFYTMFVKASLELRLEAAERLEIQHLASSYRGRLDALTR